jgi:hypothetical protein
MANAIEAAADRLVDEIRRQLETWNHRPLPSDDVALVFPRVGGLPSVEHSEQAIGGRIRRTVATFGRESECSPPPASAWWTRANRERYGQHCQATVKQLANVLIEAARSTGASAVLIEPLADLRRRHDDFLWAAVGQGESGMFRTAKLRDAWQAIFPAADRLCELVDELVAGTKPLELTPVQEAIYGALTNEYQTVPEIAVASGVNDDSVRRELGNLKLRLKLVDHKHGQGYRRL